MTLRAAIIGSGNIGCDILCKTQRSDMIDCTVFAGRSARSLGLEFAEHQGVATTARGIDGLMEQADAFDLVFDATSSTAHQENARRFEEAGKTVINLTPAPLGEMCIPTLNGDALLDARNINMITCGGQASIPIAAAICQSNVEVDYIEVVSSISADSAGPATRVNLNHYLTATETAIAQFTGCARVKSILNINPAKPSVYMQTAISALVKEPDMVATKRAIARAARRVRQCVPGYEVIVAPHHDEGRLFTMVRVVGQGDYLDPCAGNLDIITSASVSMAERIVHHRSAKQPRMVIWK